MDTINNESLEDYDLVRNIENYDLVEKAIPYLTNKQERVIRLHYWYDLDFREIGDLTNTTFQNASLHHSKAINKLKRVIESELI